jgi:hypothetical protein
MPLLLLSSSSIRPKGAAGDAVIRSPSLFLLLVCKEAIPAGMPGLVTTDTIPDSTLPGTVWSFPDGSIMGRKAVAISNSIIQQKQQQVIVTVAVVVVARSHDDDRWRIVLLVAVTPEWTTR